MWWLIKAFLLSAPNVKVSVFKHAQWGFLSQHHLCFPLGYVVRHDVRAGRESGPWGGRYSEEGCCSLNVCQLQQFAITRVSVKYICSFLFRLVLPSVCACVCCVLCLRAAGESCWWSTLMFHRFSSSVPWHTNGTVNLSPLTHCCYTHTHTDNTELTLQRFFTLSTHCFMQFYNTRRLVCYYFNCKGRIFRNGRCFIPCCPRIHKLVFCCST